MFQRGGRKQHKHVFVSSRFLLLNHLEPQFLTTHNANRHCRVRFFTFAGQPLSKQLYIKSTVATVKQRYNMKEAAATNGPEGTVSEKTQVPLELLEQGMARLQNNLKSINEDYLGDVDLRTVRY